MNGGEISGNTAISGGGVYVNGSTSRFYMTGGELSGNKASANGGGVYLINGYFLIMTGTVYGIDAGDLSNSITGTSNTSALYTPDTRAAYGTFSNPNDLSNTWTRTDYLANTDDTIRVVNGVLQ